MLEGQREKNGRGGGEWKVQKTTNLMEGHFCSSSIVKASLKGCLSVLLWVCFNCFFLLASVAYAGLCHVSMFTLTNTNRCHCGYFKNNIIRTP